MTRKELLNKIKNHHKKETVVSLAFKKALAKENKHEES